MLPVLENLSARKFLALQQQTRKFLTSFGPRLLRQHNRRKFQPVKQWRSLAESLSSMNDSAGGWTPQPWKPCKTKRHHPVPCSSLQIPCTAKEYSLPPYRVLIHNPSILYSCTVLKALRGKIDICKGILQMVSGSRYDDPCGIVISS